MASDLIDGLLVRYLGLLHEYTDLRSQLAVRQSAMYTNLARANFAAERGFRYGPDHYDGRMQALVQLSVTEASGGGGTEHVPLYAVVRPKKEAKAEEMGEETEKGEEEEKQDESETVKTAETPATAKTAKKSKAAAPAGPRDPLQWFGVLTPMALRQAQTEAIGAIDSIIPRLASLSAEMAAVEIEVRRARKKLARTRDKQDNKQGNVPAESRDGSEKTTAPTVSV